MLLKLYPLTEDHSSAASSAISAQKYNNQQEVNAVRKIYKCVHANKFNFCPLRLENWDHCKLLDCRPSTVSADSLETVVVAQDLSTLQVGLD